MCKTLKSDDILYDVYGAKCRIVCPGCSEIISVNSSSTGMSGVTSFSVHNFSRHLKKCKPQFAGTSNMNVSQSSNQNVMTSANSIDSPKEVTEMIDLTKSQLEIDRLCAITNQEKHNVSAASRTNRLESSVESGLRIESLDGLLSELSGKNIDIFIILDDLIQT